MPSLRNLLKYMIVYIGLHDISLDPNPATKKASEDSYVAAGIESS